MSPRFGESFSLDWLAVIDGPSIHKVEGCVDRYHPDRNRGTSMLEENGWGREERRMPFEFQMLRGWVGWQVWPSPM